MGTAEELAAELPDLTRTVDVQALDRWLERQGLTMAELRRPDRDGFHVEARRQAAGFLRRRGWSFPMIGDYLERDHTTVMRLLQPRGGRRGWSFQRAR